MQITCINCKQTWEVYAGHLLVARIRFGLGFVEHTFICPNCQAKNVIPATEFEASDHPSPLVPVFRWNMLRLEPQTTVPARRQTRNPVRGLPRGRCTRLSSSEVCRFCVITSGLLKPWTP
jgi:hypothetical protein